MRGTGRRPRSSCPTSIERRTSHGSKTSTPKRRPEKAATSNPQGRKSGRQAAGGKTRAPRFEIANYSEHALSSGEEAAAIAYIQIKLADGKTRWGAGVDTNIELASVRAVLSALNRL